MTVLNALLTEERGWMAQDHAAYAFDNLPPMDVTAAESTVKARKLGHADKLAVFPDNRLLVGTVGNVMYAKAWLETVDHMDMDIDELRAIAPETLRRLLREHSAPMPELRVLHVGYSPLAGRVAGVMFDWQDDFEPTFMAPGQVVHSPHVDADAPGADRLNELGAAGGERAGELLEALFRNQRWQCDNRRLRAGVLLSDDYTLASVDESGARLIEAHSGAETAAA